MKEKIQVHIADDHKILIEGIVAVINTESDIEIEGFIVNFKDYVESKLTESQFTRCAVYRVLSEYALPQLTKWNADGEEDKFQVMMDHYDRKYNEEFDSILRDGVEYDFDGDSTVQSDEKQPFHTRRLVR